MFLLTTGMLFAQGQTWYLNNVTYDTGATASGSFDFDATTDTYSNINITIENSPNHGTTNYGVINTSSPGNSTFMSTVPELLANLTGSPYAGLNFASSLTNAGGTIDILPNPPGFSFQSTCSNANCSLFGGPADRISTGSVTTARTWYLNNVTYDTGATASGSFDYDAVSNTYSNINITIENSPNFGTTTYGVRNPSSLGNSTFMSVVAELLPDLTGIPVLDYSFASSLTNTGGTIDILPNPPGFSFQSTCSDANCTGITGPADRVSTGSITTLILGQCGSSEDINVIALDTVVTLAPNDELGQPFTATCTGVITGITMRFNNTNSSGTGILRIYNDVNGTTALIEAPVTIPLDANGDDIFIALPGPVLLASGVQYTFGFTEGTFNSGYRASDNDPYPNGTVLQRVAGTTGSWLRVYPTQDLRFIVHYKDAVPPIAICQDFTAQLDASGNVTILTSDIDNGSSDIDGPITLSLDNNTFNCSQLGANTVTLTVTDGEGNTATCTATVTVEDTISPTLTCPADINLTCLPTQVTYSLPTISDNCSLPIIPIPTTVAGFTLLGTLDNSTYFLSDTDATGATAFNDAMTNGYKIITINNAQENQYIADQITLAGIGSVLIGFNDLATEGSFVWQSEQPNSYTYWNIGEPNNANAGEDYTALTSNGTWNDVETGTGRYIIEFTDGIIQIAGLPSGSFFPNGTTTNTFYIEDASGNGSTCSFNVVIDDSEAPIIACPVDITSNNDIGECGATLSIPAPVITDNCGNTLIPDTFMVPYNFDTDGDLIDTPSTLSNLTASTTDVVIELIFSGDHNSPGEEFILTGPDAVVIFSESDIDPVCVITTRMITIPQATWNNWITTYGANLSFTLLTDSSVNDGQCNSSPNNFYQLRAIQFGNISFVNDYTGTQDASASYPVGTTTVTWTATDNSGNTTTCTQTIVVNDTEAPVITICSANIVINNDAGVCGATLSIPVPVATDNCENEILPDTQMVPYNFDTNGRLIDTPSTLSNLTASTTDVVIELTFSGDHDNTPEDFILTGPDAVVIFSENEINPICVIATRMITIPQATWNNWITTYGANLSF
ncbi:MAG: HYR domain-containing protein, partial [Flavobacteriaceae bacterium]|nr:HYR domain-containing protein [Flavobacteriaceae bacterium]